MKEVENILDEIQANNDKIKQLKSSNKRLRFFLRNYHSSITFVLLMREYKKQKIYTVSNKLLRRVEKRLGN